MVSKKEIHEQLKKIKFNQLGWGRSEAAELPSIILPDEEIYECVNGMYEGGFALLVVTDIRVLLIDKKPLNFLTVEDMRFDMITQIDYNHRLFGADIGISAGSKNLRFRSYNQPKLRKLIGHVQHCMAESKKKQSDHQDTQVSHLEQINVQLQAYLSAQAQYQHQLQQMQMQQHNQGGNEQAQAPQPVAVAALPAPPKPSNELADYLYAQSLLAQHEENLKKEALTSKSTESSKEEVESTPQPQVQAQPIKIEEPKRVKRPMEESQVGTAQEIYQEGMREVFGNQFSSPSVSSNTQPAQSVDSNYEVNTNDQPPTTSNKRFEINPLQIAYSKLPIALRRKKFDKSLPVIPTIDPTVTGL
jgi:hypothetical protein